MPRLSDGSNKYICISPWGGFLGRTSLPVEDSAFSVHHGLHGGSVGGANEHGRHHKRSDDVLNGLRTSPTAQDPPWLPVLQSL